MNFKVGKNLLTHVELANYSKFWTSKISRTTVDYFLTNCTIQGNSKYWRKDSAPGIGTGIYSAVCTTC